MFELSFKERRVPPDGLVRRFSMHISLLPRHAGLAMGLAFLSACSSTSVHPQRETGVVGLQRPQQILVYDFATSDADVSANSSSTSAARAKAEGKSMARREAEVARDAVNALSDDLVADLVKLGFHASRAKRGTVARDGDLVVDGQFIDIDEGNRLKRIVIGFGAGGSKVNTNVQVYQGGTHNKLLAFSTHADSGEMPGAAVTMTAGAVATGGVSVAGAAATAAVGGVKAHRSATAQMAGRSADQASKYLSEFFAKEGWIAEAQSKTAKRS
jgi:hypothetical protein